MYIVVQNTHPVKRDGIISTESDKYLHNGQHMHAECKESDP